MADGLWHHLVVTWEGSQVCSITAYLDGVQMVRTAPDNTLVCNAGNNQLPFDLTIGSTGMGK